MATKPLKIEELNRLYQESESVDSELFSEQRSNILLTAGDHYSKKGSRFWRRIRESKDISTEVKLRLTKNHISKICKTYVNNITSHAPDVAISPKNENELQDQKAAELHDAVWRHIKQKHKVKRKNREYAEDFIHIGEAAVKIFWDENAGELVGYEQEVDPAGSPIFRDVLTGANTTAPQSSQINEYGQVINQPNEPIQSDRPVFTGDLVFERIFGFNLLRAPEAKSFDDARFLIYRKMVDIEVVKQMVGDDEEKLKFIQKGTEDTYTVFDGAKGAYVQTRDQVMLREYYFRRSPEYPNGYYCISTPEGILWEGELPLGLFPIVYVGFDEIATTARSRSIIKQLRPFQAEINRAASKIAEHQITLGDDKVLIQHGTKISHGGQLPGVRAVQFTGMVPQFLPGRDGSQYLAYMTSQIKEMYEISNVYEDSEEKGGEQDPYALLYRSLRHKKKFSLYAEKFEGFLVEICDLVLRLFKAYSSEQTLIPAIGRREFVNIAEFKSADDLGYQIRLDPRVDDLDQAFGRQMTMNTIIQYVGTKLERDDIGKLIRNMPFGNKEEAWSDFTIDYDNATNDLLALDRGEYRAANRYDNHPYIIKRLIRRVKQADFQFLQPQVQGNYQKKIKEHEEFQAKLQEETLAAKSDLIPTGGYLVGCDFYLPVSADEPGKTRRARVPYHALDWLIRKLEAQGNSLERLEQMDPAAQADMAAFASASKGAGPEAQGTQFSAPVSQQSITGPQSPPQQGV